MNKSELIAKVKDLAPWHMDISLPEGIRTGEYHSNPDIKQEINVIDPNAMRNVFSKLYGSGLQGKRMLDVGCNSGGYCFLAKEMGARFTYGFDPRDHWINQANFIKEVRALKDDEASFAIHDLRAIEDLPIEQQFDFTLFKGVFYHLSDPIRAIEVLASRTKDYILIDSACDLRIPEEAMISKFEKVTPLMSGIEGLSWFPGGPRAIINICAQFGFEQKKVLYFRKNVNDKRSFAKEHQGRCAVLVAKSEELINLFEETE